MQKEQEWPKYKGKKVSWEGTVTETKEGTFGGLNLFVKINKDTLTSDVMITLKVDQKEKAIKLTKGSKVAFTGTLSSYGGSVMPTTLDDGEIK